MPRRHNRAPEPPPVQVEVVTVQVKGRSKAEWLEDSEFHAVKEAGWRRAHEALDKQRAARIAKQVDWSVCSIPGCDKEANLMRHAWEDSDPDPERHIALCFDHLRIAWSQVQRYRGNPELVKTVEQLNQEARDEAAWLAADEKKQHLASQDGHIYFLQQNDLIKVGWSRDLYDRLRAYGPNVKLLCHYPGRRQDETNLHRQLRPALASGREWYEDGPLIRLYLNQALERHGPPYIARDWTTPRKELTAQVRSRRR